MIKAFNATVPHVLKVSCTSRQEVSDPDPYPITAMSPFNRMSPESARVMIADAMSGNLECAMPLSEEEMYDLAAASEDSLSES